MQHLVNVIDTENKLHRNLATFVKARKEMTLSLANNTAPLRLVMNL
jgi:hypothetical protein